MRVIWFDVDSLRPDHLGCYGYHRNTSPAIDRVAAQGVRFESCHVSDAPCLPSRSALITGRFGIHNGVVNHGGEAAEPFNEGIHRPFGSRLGATSLPRALKDAGLRPVTISSFGERHSAWWWYANWAEIHNPGKGGLETADEVETVALDWLWRNGERDNWFLHVNLWDPHTPYRAPASYGDPFARDPLPAWLTEDVRRAHWEGCGPHSAREVRGFGPWQEEDRFPRQPAEMSSLEQVRRLFDGYDTGVKYADDAIGRIMDALAGLKILEDTVIVISADHGENLGELNIYGDHQTADLITTRVPLILRWPGAAARVDRGLHYQQDFAATLIELLGGKVPGIWDGVSFAPAFRAGRDGGRESLVVSQGAWSCQRSVRWKDLLLTRSYHDGYHAFPDLMLYDVMKDPHEQDDLAAAQPETVREGSALLDAWTAEMMRTATHPVDPMWTVLREGGPYHCRGELQKYLARLRDTGRASWADRLAAAHPGEP